MTRLIAIDAGGCAPPVYVREQYCRACGEAHCAHPDAVFAGIIPAPSSLPSAYRTRADHSGAVSSVPFDGTAPLSLTGETA